VLEALDERMLLSLADEMYERDEWEVKLSGHWR
jgi:hypothetical protein